MLSSADIDSSGNWTGIYQIQVYKYYFRYHTGQTRETEKQ